MQLTVNPPVTVTGDPGIYCFEPLSGTGKTLLYQVLMGARPESVVLVTYTDSMLVSFVGSDPKFVLCDRADMYRNEKAFAELIDKYKDTCMVCIDIKKQAGISDNTYATIEVSDTMEIEVDCVCL